ncbi:hypothetical protein LCGC14_1230580 [marine sediment metagenome]|uniref:Uncharacterized protein n=1 Tax=marine sediment metagenome TaxID=412755 RepID=A0A0F9LCT0_9ZZZZ
MAVAVGLLVLVRRDLRFNREVVRLMQLVLRELKHVLMFPIFLMSLVALVVVIALHFVLTIFQSIEDFLWEALGRSGILFQSYNGR